MNFDKYRVVLCCLALISFSSLAASELAQGALLARRSLLEEWKAKEKESVKPPFLSKKIIIMVDPGHGESDEGTQSISKPRYLEKSLNLITARFLCDYLRYFGYTPLMTRKTDTFVTLERRAEMTNEAKARLFVSIHYNSAPSAKAEGIEVFFFPSNEKKERAAQSKKLAQSILKESIASSGALSRGVKEGRFLVIRQTDMPAVLIEGGFMTNEKEMTNLKDPAYLKKIAWGIAQGIKKYVDG